MATAFETSVNTELPLRTSITAAPTAGNFPRFTGVGRAVEERTPAQVKADIGAVGGYTVATQTGATRNETATSGELVILCDCTSNAITVNLPTAVGNTAKFQIKKVDATTNIVTVDGATTETIDGSLTALLRVPFASITLVSNGANWFVV